MTLPTGAELDRLNRIEHLSYSDLAARYETTRGTIAGILKRYRDGQKLPEFDHAETVERDQENDNAFTVESKSERITTLAQLIAYCKIDLNEWTVERHVINKWEVGAKDAEKRIVVEPLFQVKAWLVRKVPEAIKPVIHPVNIQLSAAHPQPPSRSMAACLIIPDTQFGFARDPYTGCLTPFHDRAAIDAVLQIAQVLQPETTIHLGDIVDWSGWSDKFIRLPQFYFTAQPALIEAAWVIANFRRLTTGKTMALEGNHDIRPEKMIITHLVDAYGLKAADQLDAAPVMSVDNLLGLSRMGVDYISGYPNGEAWINDTAKCIHGEKVRGQPGQTAAAVVRDATETVIFGHIHRKELATRTIPTRGGYRTVSAYSPGCLCHIDGRVPGSKRTDQWQQGAAVVWYDEHTSYIQPIDIQNGRAFFDGRIYQGVDYTDRLRQDTAWAF